MALKLMGGMFGVQFYPTPESLVDKMYDKVNWDNVHCILEPSAGKGDLLKGFKRFTQRRTTYYYTLVKFENKKRDSKLFKSLDDLLEFIQKEFGVQLKTYEEVLDYLSDNYPETKDLYYLLDAHAIVPKIPALEFTCVEIDPNLCAILRNDFHYVVNGDFLQYQSLTKYDLILMNPPFKNGDKHLLKALHLIENGGQCVCILNAETVRNPFTNFRKELCTLLKQYNADIEFISGAFLESENSTDVEIALIYVNIPNKDVEFDVLKNLVLGEHYDEDFELFNDTQLATNDLISNLIKQYEFEANLGIKIIREYYSIQKYIPNVTKDSHKLISLTVIGCHDESMHENDRHPINNYIRSLRDKYWTLLFRSDELSNLLTEEMRKKYLAEIRKFRDYDFTYSNIKQLQMSLAGNLSNSLEAAILKQFEDLTYTYSLDKESNIHYFNGWKTNSAFMIRKKVIIRCSSAYSYFGWSFDGVKDVLVELEKIFTYLDTAKTDGLSVAEIIYNKGYTYSKGYNGERVHFKYFDVELKKKGTAHIWFTNEELLKKFNIFGCQKHGWLPNCYGKKQYKDMTKEEKSVVDSFEGKESYENVINNAHYYLSGNTLLQLETKSI